jgi:hypothetical protein
LNLPRSSELQRTRVVERLRCEIAGAPQETRLVARSWALAFDFRLSTFDSRLSTLDLRLDAIPTASTAARDLLVASPWLPLVCHSSCTSRTPLQGTDCMDDIWPTVNARIRSDRAFTDKHWGAPSAVTGAQTGSLKSNTCGLTCCCGPARSVTRLRGRRLSYRSRVPLGNPRPQSTGVVDRPGLVICPAVPRRSGLP